MVRRLVPVILCVLAAACSNSGSSSKTASTVAPATSAATGSTAATTTGSITPITTSSTTPVTTAALPAVLQPVSFATLDEGAGSPRGFAQGAHETHVATDPEWASFWPTHSNTRLPRVDFSSDCVVGTFMGQMSGGSHTTQIVGVSRDTNSDDLHATVREFRLGAWKPNTRNLTSPFHLVTCDTAVSGQGTVTVDRQHLLDFETLAAGSDSALGANDPAYTGGLHVFRSGADFAVFYATVRPGVRPPRRRLPDANGRGRHGSLHCAVRQHGRNAPSPPRREDRRAARDLPREPLSRRRRPAAGHRDAVSDPARDPRHRDRSP
ncbi:hypothetical protein OAX78_01435 [Planctomycetota bacterium]|nr:hypothetical protein [Planctomycetota bacterium]